MSCQWDFGKKTFGSYVIRWRYRDFTEDDSDLQPNLNIVFTSEESFDVLHLISFKDFMRVYTQHLLITAAFPRVYECPQSTLSRSIWTIYPRYNVNKYIFMIQSCHNRGYEIKTQRKTILKCALIFRQVPFAYSKD